MEIVHVANGDYDRYEELLLQRAHLEKKAYGYRMAYVREFGDLTVTLFQLKIDCISLKKSIAFCIAAKNRGESPDGAKLSDFLAVQMAAYREQLEEMIAERDAARPGRPLSPFEVNEVKKIYHRIARQLHPDISPLTEEYPELGDLFQRVMRAYQCNNLQELRDLEILIGRVLKDNGIDSFSAVIPDIGKRILDLENEIGQILTTEPYLYGELLADAFRIRAKRDGLEKEIEEYRKYKRQLEKQLRTVMGEEADG